MLKNTRRRQIALPQKSWTAAENPLTWNLPKAGLLQQLDLVIEITVAGSLSAENALGFAAAVDEVRLNTSLGYDLIRMSGAGYHHIYRYFIEDNKDPVPYSNARNAVTATTVRLDMTWDLAINSRDDIGLLPLQVETMQATLTVAKLADALLATGATVTGTVTPYITVLSVPDNPEDWPAFTALHSIIEQRSGVTANGQTVYQWPTGDIYLKMLHGLGVGATPSDKFDQFRVVVQQNDTLVNATPKSLDIEFGRYHGIARRASIIPFDLMSSSGLGAYGTPRDWLDTAGIADIQSVFNVLNQPTTLYTIREVLVPVRPAA